MASFEYHSNGFMEKKRIIESIEGFVTEVHKCVTRLKSIEEESVPNIELGLLEQKVIQFYDQLQHFKERNADVGKKPEPVNEVDAIKAQFESLQNEFAQQQTVPEPGAARAEKPEKVIEEPAPPIVEAVSIAPEEPATSPSEESEALEAESEEHDEELNKVLEQAEQLMEEAPPIKWEIEAETPPEPEPAVETATEPEVVTPTAPVATESIKEEAPKVEETPDPVPAEPAPVISEKEAVEEKEMEEKATSLNERFSAQKTSLHDKLSAQREKQKALSKQLSGKPIKDLKKAINLNMQIRFTKELFENDKRSFKRTVDFINKCNTYSEARSYAQHEIVQKYELNEENKFYQEFLALVKRRFI